MPGGIHLPVALFLRYSYFYKTLKPLTGFALTTIYIKVKHNKSCYCLIKNSGNALAIYEKKLENA
jgi:hypothetical protein